LFVAWVLIDKTPIGARRLSWQTSWAVTAGALAAEFLYAMLRAWSGAMTATTAPAYYQLDFTPARLLSNLAQYVDRSMTFALFVLLTFLVVSAPRRPTSTGVVRRSHPDLASIVLFGLLWWAGGFALTIFLPVRSSLYACFPSVGVAIASAAIAAEGWRRLDARQRWRAVAVGVALPFCLWPVYHARNRRMAAEAELSAQTLSVIQGQTDVHAGNLVILLKDDRTGKPSLDDSFGALLQSAVNLVVSPRVVAAIDPPPTDDPTRRLTSRPDVTLVLKNGRLVEER